MADRTEARQILHAQLNELLKRHEVLENHLTNRDREVPQDWSDQATFRENDEVLEQLDDKARAEIEAVRAALARVDDGSYGTCAKCGGDIADGRLKVLPAAALCTGCAA